MRAEDVQNFKQSKREHIRKHVKDTLVTLDDGYKYFYPVDPGAYSSDDLRIVADYLDELNAAWDKQIKEYFEKEVDVLKLLKGL